MLIFQNGTQKKLFAHAEAEYPRECCGILLGRQEEGQRSVYCVIPAENAAGEQQRNAHFQLDPLEVLRAEAAAEQRRLEIVGFYHSHPDHQAVASGEDLRHMIPGYSYPILSVDNGTCVGMRSFEKSLQNGVQEEILIKEK